jgi:phenylalanyl-tRNA synthetase alpha chain
MSLDDVYARFTESLSKASNMQALEQVRLSFLGKSGALTFLMQGISSMPIEDRKAYGAEINKIKSAIEESISAKRSVIEKAELEESLLQDAIDVTLQPRIYTKGGAHPVSQAIRDIENIFAQLGFSMVYGPEIEDEWYNFTALNIPSDHPARQMHDTFYIDGSDNLLLRTHTSSVQIRHMQNASPPSRIVSIGRVYRSDDDATHTPMFHQVEGLCIDKNITMGHMKYIIESFLQQFFQIEKLPIRLRPSFFPFTEPSAEVDVQCDRSSKSSIQLGVGTDWLEILGCGMVHPEVLKNMSIDPNEYRGFAFGIGLERLVMLKYNIPDLRALFSGNLWC